MSQDEHKPLLVIPSVAPADKEKRPPSVPQLRVPSHDRQRERIGPRLAELQSAFEARRIQIQSTAPADEPELVLVLETVGAVDDFYGAVQKTPGLEWLFELEESSIAPGDDFFDRSSPDKPLAGRAFLIGSNQQALAEIVSLWNLYKDDSKVRLQTGLNKWKDVFKHLHDVRFWSVQDRLTDSVREYWETKLASGDASVRFEIEAWCYASTGRNEATAVEVTRYVAELGGRVLKQCLLQEIAYHGFLVEVPSTAIALLLGDNPPLLARSERVMVFRGHGQALSPHVGSDSIGQPVVVPAALPSGDPIVALLDGLPMQNHPLLASRLMVDDPDDWARAYPAANRVHGTAMASLLVHGDLEAPTEPLSRPVYVRPIMRPDPTDWNVPPRECTPEDDLLIDLTHRAVKRIFDGEGEAPPAAPTVRVINLSVGDLLTPFDTEISPWAKLIDWLSEKYRVLFVVSAGNSPAELQLPVAAGSLSALSKQDQSRLADRALFADTVGRRLISPAEALNAITVGAVHSDASTCMPVPSRYDLFPLGGVAPYSRIGHGFRRAIKPEVVLPGGRMLYREHPRSRGPSTDLVHVDSSAPPGHLVASPPNGSKQTAHTRGTSNSAAIASRHIARLYEVVDALRAANPGRLDRRFDAVLLKALLVHGASWNDLQDQVVAARPDLAERRRQQSLLARFVGYGSPDIDRVIACTDTRATLVGIGEVDADAALEFRLPLPPCMRALTEQRRLTVTLAWLSPVKPRHAKYRQANLWIKPPSDEFSADRVFYDWQQVKRGTVQHEVLAGDAALAFADGDALSIKVNCVADAGKLASPVRFALCVSLEVAEGLGLPVYQQVRERVAPRVQVGATA